MNPKSLLFRVLGWIVLTHKQGVCDKCGRQDNGHMYLCAQHNPNHPAYEGPF